MLDRHVYSDRDAVQGQRAAWTMARCGRWSRRQAAAGVDGIVPVGTTGESPTLDYEEHLKVIEVAIEAAAGEHEGHRRNGGQLDRGSDGVDAARARCGRGRDAAGDARTTTSPTQEGLMRHFSAVADLGLPVMLYNVPGRTGREIAVDTVARLCRGTRRSWRSRRRAAASSA